jgi:hypothetical protein
MWHKRSLKSILLESNRQRYNFDGQAGSMGGEVTKALFKYCPTIKSGRAALDGEQITDLEIKIGTGYTVIGYHDATTSIVTEPTNTQDAHVEIGFEGKKITIGSFKPGGYAGLSIKPNTVPLRFFQIRNRTFGQLLYDVPSCGNPTDKPMSIDKFYNSISTVVKDIRLSRESEERIMFLVTSRGGSEDDAIREIDRLNMYFATENWSKERKLINQCFDGVEVSGSRRRPVWSGENVLQAQSSARLFWVEFYPNKNIPEIVTTLEQQMIICRPSELWKKARPKKADGSTAPVPSDLDDSKWVVRSSNRLDDEWTIETIQLRYGRRGNQGGALSTSNQAAIWNAIGDDYFVFLDIQRGEHLAHLVRTPTAPIQAIGHWDMMAFARGNVPDTGSFTVETNPQTNKLKITSIPELQTKEIPLLDSTYFKGDKNWVLTRHPGRFAVGLAYNDIDWAQAEKYPFNEEMLEMIRPYDRGEI